jgi:peptidoglycan/LPS O-acetylase OafA/YrhL
MNAPSTFSPTARLAMIAVVIDLALVMVFVLIGRGSHDEGFTVLGSLNTAWPFLTGLAVGWLAARAGRKPLSLRRTAAPVWASTVVIGVILRAVSGQGVAVSFVIVTLLVLAVFLFGWRALASFAVKRRASPTGR